MTGGDARVSTRRGNRAVRAKRRTRGGFVAIKMVGPIPDARNFQRGTAFHDISRPISGVEGEAGMGKVLLLLLSRDISNKRIPPFSSVLTFRPASSESLLLVIQGLTKKVIASSLVIIIIRSVNRFTCYLRRIEKNFTLLLLITVEISNRAYLFLLSY